MWTEFLLTSLIVVILPGTGVIYTIGVGMAQGSWPSVAAAFGCTLGIVPHITAAILGVAVILHTSALVFTAFKFIGVAYLLYLAWSVLRDDGPLQFKTETESRPMAKIAATGFLINILNPKLSIFFLAFLPQFVPANAGAPLSVMVGLSAIFMAMTFVVFVGYGAFAARIRRTLLSSTRTMTWVRRGFAVAFVALGARMMVESA